MSSARNKLLERFNIMLNAIYTERSSIIPTKTCGVFISPVSLPAVEVRLLGTRLCWKQRPNLMSLLILPPGRSRSNSITAKFDMPNPDLMKFSNNNSIHHHLSEIAKLLHHTDKNLWKKCYQPPFLLCYFRSTSYLLCTPYYILP